MNNNLLFLLFSAVALFSAFGVVFSRKTMISAYFMILCMCGLSGLYFVLGAGFIGSVQIIVYAGAVMVLFVISIMLVDSSSESKWQNRSLLFLIPALIVCSLFVFTVFKAASEYSVSRNSAVIVENPGYASVKNLGMVLFNKYILPLEAVSFVVIAALIGAVTLGKRNLGKKKNQVKAGDADE